MGQPNALCQLPELYTRIELESWELQEMISIWLLQDINLFVASDNEPAFCPASPDTLISGSLLLATKP